MKDAQIPAPLFALIVMPIILILAYWAPLHDIVVFFDYQSIVGPLERYHSLRDYWSALGHLRTIDLQPIRDLSYFLDLQLLPLVGKQIFFYSNLFYWLCCTLLFHRLAQKLLTHHPPLMIVLLSSLFLVHPLLVYSTPWIAGRKHILALLFLLAAADATLAPQHRTRSLKIVGHYLASLLAQPIHLLFPCAVAALLWSRGHWRQERLLLTLLGVIMVVMGGLNYYYYAHILSDPAQVDLAMMKFTPEQPLVYKLLAAGRFFYQILISWQNALFYEPSDLNNLLGLLCALFLLPLTLFWSTLTRAQLIFCWAMVAGPLLVLYTKTTNIFFLNYYALGPLVAILILLAALKLARPLQYGLLGVTILLSTLLQNRQNQVWSNIDTFLAQNYQQSQSCLIGTWYAMNLWNQNAKTQAQQLSWDLIQRECVTSGVNFGEKTIALFLLTLFYDETISAEFKIDKINEMPIAADEKALLKLILSAAQDATPRQQLAQQLPQIPHLLTLYHPFFLYLKNSCGAQTLPDHSCQQILTLLR